MVTDWWKSGRTPFPVTDKFKDYSGRDFNSLYLEDSDALSHSFFNGATVVDCVFANVQLDYGELAEAYFAKSHFFDTNLAVSDFVRTSLEDTIFEGCDFSNGDWRESKFNRVKFLNCKFSHTTINLCIFKDCDFALSSNDGLDHRSVSYNIFSRCKFKHHLTDEMVLARNFGLPGPDTISSIIPSGGRTTLELICRLSASGQVTVADLVEAIENECGVQQKARLKKLRLEFISNIIAAQAHDRRISPSSLIFIENIFTTLARSARDETDFLAAMGALINLRNAIFDLASNYAGNAPDPEAPCESIVLAFKGQYSEDEAEVLAHAASEVIFGNLGDVIISYVQQGSTIIEYLLMDEAKVAHVLSGLNLILAQAKILFRRVKSIRGWTHKKKPKPRPKRRKNPKSSSAKLPAILTPEIAIPQLASVRIAVERDGRTLIRFDNHVEIEIRHL